RFKLGKRRADVRRRLIPWLAVVALVPVLVGFYLLYRHTNNRILSSDQVMHASGSDLAAVPPLTPSTEQATPAAGEVSGSESAVRFARARRGLIADQMSLAQAYLEGDGVLKNQEKAASWFIIAGENGSAKAKRRSIEITRGMARAQIARIRFDVGKMYKDGTGVRKNYISAHTWFELSKAAGDIRAEDEEKILRTRMQPAQVKEGQNRASAWLRSHFRRVHDRL